MGNKRAKFKVTIKLMIPLAERIEDMADDREMKLEDLLAELIQLGEMSLRHDRVEPQMHRQGEAEYVTHRP